MKHIINKPENIVPEMMEGFMSAYSKYYEKVPNVDGVILLKDRRKDKVALVIGGGGGHEPMFAGFVGKGLADAAACGAIFTSPDPITIYEAAKAANAGKGVLFVYGCYAGDNLNFDMAAEMLEADGIKTDTIRVWDDCTSAAPDNKEQRRGIAGDVYMVKMAGALCDAGHSLDEIVKIMDKARENLRSIGIATSPGNNPSTNKTTFDLNDSEIEYGMGLHGEPGIKRAPMTSADELVEIMYKNLVADMPLKKGDEICVLINGLGSSTIIEMSIVYRKVKQLLDEAGVKVYDADINNYCTSLGMGGFSITFFRIDSELKKYYDTPCFCPYYAKM